MFFLLKKILDETHACKCWPKQKSGVNPDDADDDNWIGPEQKIFYFRKDS